MVREVGPSQLAEAQATGKPVIDVRDPAEYVGGHVPGARNIPLSLVPVRLSELPRDEELYVVCAGGGRSVQAADFLTRAGYNAVSVVGGTSAWISAGRPVATGARPNG